MDVDAWQLAWVFKHHSLRSFKLTQVAQASFELLLVDSPDGVEERLRRALVVLGWGELDIQVRIVDELVVRGDKPRSFVNELCQL